MASDSAEFCPDLCREKIEEKIECEIKRLESIMEEREKAVALHAQTQIIKEQQEQVERFVSREEFDDKIKSLRDEISGPLGLELRMRQVEQESHGAQDREKRIGALEQARGIIDAKMWMILLGVPLAVSAVVTTIIYVMMSHISKGGG